MKNITDKQIGDLRRALLGMEGALHLIGEHTNTFKSIDEIADYANKIVDWADLEDLGDGLFAHPGSLTNIGRD